MPQLSYKTKTTRNAPNFAAKQFPGVTMTGLSGKQYTSKQDKNGVWRWIPAKSKKISAKKGGANNAQNDNNLQHARSIQQNVNNSQKTRILEQLLPTIASKLSIANAARMRAVSKTAANTIAVFKHPNLLEILDTMHLIAKDYTYAQKHEAAYLAKRNIDYYEKRPLSKPCWFVTHGSGRYFSLSYINKQFHAEVFSFNTNNDLIHYFKYSGDTLDAAWNALRNAKFEYKNSTFNLYDFYVNHIFIKKIKEKDYKRIEVSYKSYYGSECDKICMSDATLERYANLTASKSTYRPYYISQQDKPWISTLKWPANNNTG